jgi:hypothetical protein
MAFNDLTHTDGTLRFTGQARKPLEPLPTNDPYGLDGELDADTATGHTSEGEVGDDRGDNQHRDVRNVQGAATASHGASGCAEVPPASVPVLRRQVRSVDQASASEDATQSVGAEGLTLVIYDRKPWLPL